MLQFSRAKLLRNWRFSTWAELILHCFCLLASKLSIFSHWWVDPNVCSDLHRWNRSSCQWIRHVFDGIPRHERRICQLNCARVDVQQDYWSISLVESLNFKKNKKVIKQMRRIFWAGGLKNNSNCKNSRRDFLGRLNIFPKLEIPTVPPYFVAYADFLKLRILPMHSFILMSLSNSTNTK